MRVSGKKILLIMFSVALGLVLWIRAVAPKLKGGEAKTTIQMGDQPKPQRGYRTKMFPTMEEARTIAEKKINENAQNKSLITKYEASQDGWLFYYESEKYLNSGKQTDRIPGNVPILVHKDGSTEFFTGEKPK